MTRTAILWTTGILASGIIGGMLAAVVGQIVQDHEDPWFFVGVLAGMCAFVCARLWLAERKA
jgi:uncharacterized membrane protein